MDSSYLDPVKISFRTARNPKKAAQMKAYMRDKFECLGLSATERRRLQKDFFKENGFPKQEDVFELVFDLWEQDEREFQHFALDILQKFQKQFVQDDIGYLERLIVSKSWWDSVDGLAVWCCGEYFKLYPSLIDRITKKWIDSKNIWLQRSVLLFQLKYKSNTDTERLANWIVTLHKHPDFFIRKAIGWILREYSKTNPKWVTNFAHSIQLSPLSKKEALRVILKGK